MYPRCLQQLRLSWLQTRIVTAPPTLPDNNNPSSEGQFFCRNTKEHQGHQNDVGIKRKLFLPVLVLPTAPPIVATTLEDLKYTRPPDSRPPTGDDQAKQFHRHPSCCCIPPPGGRVSTQWSLLGCLLSSYSGVEISTLSKMMIRVVMILLTIIWSSIHQGHGLFRSECSAAAPLQGDLDASPCS